jgi:hypothetical protein
MTMRPKSTRINPIPLINNLILTLHRRRPIFHSQPSQLHPSKRALHLIILPIQGILRSFRVQHRHHSPTIQISRPTHHIPSLKIAKCEGHVVRVPNGFIGLGIVFETEPFGNYVAFETLVVVAFGVESEGEEAAETFELRLRAGEAVEGSVADRGVVEEDAKGGEVALHAGVSFEHPRR